MSIEIMEYTDRHIDRIDQPLILTNECYVNKLFLGRLNTSDWSTIRPVRGGVIFYTLENGKFLFGFGIDKNTKGITDFGGWIRYPMDINAINGSFREFQEETFKAYPTITKPYIMNCLGIVSNVSMEMLVPAPYSSTEMTKIFRQTIYHQQSKKVKIEVIDLIWLNTDELLGKLIDVRQTFHPRIRELLICTYLQFGDITYYLSNIQVGNDVQSD